LQKKPNGSFTVSQFLPLILTLKLDQTTFTFFDRLRQQYFPSAKNFLSAHVTLFHRLPGDQEHQIQQVLQALCSDTSILSLTFPGLRFLGQGVAVEVSSPALVHLRQQLATEWSPWLTRQDQQRYKPHVTLQNKVTSEAAHELYDRLNNEWQCFSGQGEGVLLWYYKGGEWELASEFPFLTNL
jgi:2'-5' RNA ligase